MTSLRSSEYISGSSSIFPPENGFICDLTDKALDYQIRVSESGALVKTLEKK